MAYSARIIADSISPRGDRLITQEVKFPRSVLAEFNTHRALSKNSASSRAIPVEKQIKKVLDEPYIPVYWGINQPGMQATNELNPEMQTHAESLWLELRDRAVLGACALIGGTNLLEDGNLAERIEDLKEKYCCYTKPLDIALHKQDANRALEPFMWQTVIVSGTEWENFYALRANIDAHPAIRTAAELMKEAQDKSTPKLVENGDWHFPFLQPDEKDLPEDVKIKICIGRCARVSYLTHDGKRSIEADLELYDKLTSKGHMSPTEHIATPILQDGITWSGNFKGWHQHRKDIPNEENYANLLLQIEHKQDLNND